MRRARADAQVLNQRYACKLHADNLHTPLLSPAAAHARKLVEYLAVHNVSPHVVSEICADLASAGISYRVFKIIDSEQSFLDVSNLVSNNRIEPDTLAVGRGCAQPRDVLRTWHDVLVKHLIDFERPAPVKPWLDLSFKLAQSYQRPAFVWLDDDEGKESVPNSLQDLEQSVEHRLLLEPFNGKGCDSSKDGAQESVSAGAPLGNTGSTGSTEL